MPSFTFTRGADGLCCAEAHKGPYLSTKKTPPLIPTINCDREAHFDLLNCSEKIHCGMCLVHNSLSWAPYKFPCHWDNFETHRHTCRTLRLTQTKMYLPLWRDACKKSHGYNAGRTVWKTTWTNAICQPTIVRNAPSLCGETQEKLLLPTITRDKWPSPTQY